MEGYCLFKIREGNAFLKSLWIRTMRKIENSDYYG